jgi:tetratricopeptide (TPR) repeat protein
MATLAVAIVAAATFAPTVGFELTNWDDTAYVSNSALVRDLSPSGWVRIFDPRSHVVYDWTPIATLTYAFEFHAGGGIRPALHHGVNVALHALTAACVVGLLLRAGLGLGLAAAAALLFAVHPLQVESVAWVSGRKTVLATLFGVACARVWLGRETRGARIGALLLFVGALLSKATLVALPLFLATADRLRGRLGTTLPWLLVMLLLALVRTVVSVWAQADPVADVRDLGLSARLAVMGPVLLTYLRQVLLPLDLAAHYSWPPAGWTELRVLASWGAIVALAGAVALQSRHSRPVALAAAWVVAALLPVANLLPAPHLQADRYLYTALAMGGVLVLAPVSTRLRRLPPAVPAALLCTIVLALAGASVVRSRVWQSSVTLWEDTARKDPDFAVAHGNLGSALLLAGEIDRAESSLRRALAIEPRLTESRLALATLLRQRGARGEAQRQVDVAREMEPNDHGPMVLAGELAELRGDIDEARRLYERAIEVYPAAVRALERLAILDAESGETTRALERIRKAVKLRPDSKTVAVSEAWVLARAGERNAAEEKLRTLAERDPEWAEPVYLLALIRLEDGNTTGGRAALDRTLERNPEHVRARIRRAELALADGERDRAEGDLRVAVGLAPARLTAVVPLADLLVEQGRRAEALELLERSARARESPEVLGRMATLLEKDDPDRARVLARRALVLLDGKNGPATADLERIAR